MSEQTEQVKKAAVESLYANNGNVTAMCRALKISRTQFYQWKKDDKEFSQAIDNVVEYNIDKVEDALMRQIEKGDTTAIIFFLKTIGKKRGYVERSEINFNHKPEVLIAGDDE